MFNRFKRKLQEKQKKKRKKDGGDKWKLNYKMVDLNLNMTIISFKYQWNKHFKGKNFKWI